MSLPTEPLRILFHDLNRSNLGLRHQRLGQRADPLANVEGGNKHDRGEQDSDRDVSPLHLLTDTKLGFQLFHQPDT